MNERMFMLLFCLFISYFTHFFSNIVILIYLSIYLFVNHIGTFQILSQFIFWLFSNFELQIHAFFISTAFISTERQCSLTFSWIDLQILLRCWYIHKMIIILSQFLYLLYLCPCLDLILFMSYLSNLLSFSSLFS